MPSTDELLTRKVSYHEAAWSLPADEPSVQAVLNDIRDGKLAAQIHHLRDLLSRGERDQYSVDKKRLPGVTFSGTFNGRRQLRTLKDYNDLLVLDVDHMDDDDLMFASDDLREDAHVLACWKSPSAEGLKGLVSLSFSEEHVELDVVVRHRAAFAQVSSYFKNTYGIALDKSGSDITRLCFLSSDPGLHIRAAAVPFTVSEIPDSVNLQPSRSAGRRPTRGSTGSDAARGRSLNRTEGKNRPHERAAMRSIIKYLQKRRVSITSSYDRWVRVALAIAGAFTYDVGRVYFLRLCRLDGDGHDEEGSIRLLESCYDSSRGEITLGTITHYARESGYRQDV
jgi:hypothetical protein